MHRINSKPPALSNSGNSAMRACLNSSEEHSTSGMQMVLSPRPALTSFSFSSTVQGTLQRLLFAKQTNFADQLCCFPFFEGGKEWKRPPFLLFSCPLRYGAKFACCSCSAAPFCIRYNLFAAVVHGHYEVQLQLDCMHLKLNLQCVNTHTA